jgi:hypothetical protein
MKSSVPAAASGEVQRVASRFALVAFGGWLARDICGWSKDESVEAAQKVFKAWGLMRAQTEIQTRKMQFLKFAIF